MSKTCEDLSVDLSAFFDGEVEGEAREAVEAHLLECDACRARLDRMLKIRFAMRQMVHPSGKRRSILEDLRSRLDALDQEHKPTLVS